MVFAEDSSVSIWNGDCEALNEANVSNRDGTTDSVSFKRHVKRPVYGLKSTYQEDFQPETFRKSFLEDESSQKIEDC